MLTGSEYEPRRPDQGVRRIGEVTLFGRPLQWRCVRVAPLFGPCEWEADWPGGRVLLKTCNEGDFENYRWWEARLDAWPVDLASANDPHPSPQDALDDLRERAMELRVAVMECVPLPG